MVNTYCDLDLTVQQVINISIYLGNMKADTYSCLNIRLNLGRNNPSQIQLGRIQNIFTLLNLWRPPQSYCHQRKCQILMMLGWGYQQYHLASGFVPMSRSHFLHCLSILLLTVVFKNSCYFSTLTLTPNSCTYSAHRSSPSLCFMFLDYICLLCCVLGQSHL